MNIRFKPWPALTLAAAILAAGPVQAQVAGTNPYSASPYLQSRQQGYTSADNPYAPGGLYDPYRGSRKPGTGAAGMPAASGSRVDAAAGSGGVPGVGTAGAMASSRKSKLRQSQSLAGSCGIGSGLGSGGRASGGLGSPGLGGMNYGSAASGAGSGSLSSINRRCANSGSAGLGQSSSRLGSPGMSGQMGGSAATSGQGRAAQMQTRQYQKLENVPR